MSRLTLTLLTAAVLAAAAPAQEAKKLTIRWHGQSFFDIRTSAGTKIVLDPHAIDAYGPQPVEADLILSSHFHNDHTQYQVIKDHQKAKLIEGLKDEKGDRRRVTWNLVDEKFKDVRVRSVGTYHDTVGGMNRGLNAVFVIEADGFKIVHLGDLAHQLSPQQLKAIGPVDILMIPVGGVYTLNGSDAKTVVEQLKPRYYILPMHYGTKVFDDVLTADEFLDEQKHVKKLTSNQLTIDVGMKAPAEPTIVTMNWTDR